MNARAHCGARKCIYYPLSRGGIRNRLPSPRPRQTAGTKSRRWKMEAEIEKRHALDIVGKPLPEHVDKKRRHNAIERLRICQAIPKTQRLLLYGILGDASTRARGLCANGSGSALCRFGGANGKQCYTYCCRRQYAAFKKSRLWLRKGGGALRKASLLLDWTHSLGQLDELVDKRVIHVGIALV